MIISLLASGVAPGHCVIVNESDRPTSRLVAVVFYTDTNYTICRYLSKNAMSGYLMPKTASVTPVAHFGVEVQFRVSSNEYLCASTGEPTKALYANGSPRSWQPEDRGLLPQQVRYGASEFARLMKEILN